MADGRIQNTPAVRHYFEAEAADYAQRSGRRLWSWWRERERRALWRILQPRAGERILDAGCGAGFYTGALRRRGARVVGVDFIPSMAKECRRLHSVPVFAADLTRPFARPVFDAVLCAGALEFCDRPEMAIRCLAAGLKWEQASRLVLMVPTDRMIGRLYRRYHARHRMSIRLFSPDDLEGYARGAGLRIDRVTRVGFNLLTRYRPSENRAWKPGDGKERQS